MAAEMLLQLRNFLRRLLIFIIFRLECLSLKGRNVSRFSRLIIYVRQYETIQVSKIVLRRILESHCIITSTSENTPINLKISSLFILYVCGPSFYIYRDIYALRDLNVILYS